MLLTWVLPWDFGILNNFNAKQGQRTHSSTSLTAQVALVPSGCGQKSSRRNELAWRGPSDKKGKHCGHRPLESSRGRGAGGMLRIRDRVNRGFFLKTDPPGACYPEPGSTDHPVRSFFGPFCPNLYS